MASGQELAKILCIPRRICVRGKDNHAGFIATNILRPLYINREPAETRTLLGRSR